MRNHALFNEIHRIPANHLALLLPHLTPFNDYAYAVRGEFARWLMGQFEDFGSWQAAWNRWVRAGVHRPGRLTLTTRCSECKGKGFSTRYPGRGACPKCWGRRQEHINTVALYCAAPRRGDSP